METLVVLAVLGLIGVTLYRQGKRIGSRKGYHVGRSRARRNR